LSDYLTFSDNDDFEFRYSQVVLDGTMILFHVSIFLIPSSQAIKL